MGSTRNLQLSPSDLVFREDFEAGKISPQDFSHLSHLRLAYICLNDRSSDEAYQLMRELLHQLLRRNDIDVANYHDTLTRAWILAVRHFMQKTQSALSADDFIDQNPMMLDPKIMNTHYSAETLFSDVARVEFTEPDLSPIPRHD